MRNFDSWMKAVREMWGLAMAALLVAAAAAVGQGQSAASTPAVLISSGTAALALRPQPAGDELIREIDDPHSGARWLLYRDRAHPEGPGRLVEASSRPVSASHLWPGRSGSHPLPAILAGDRVVLEEDSPVASARLQAVALNAAGVGSQLRIRLQIGGRVVQAIAEGPGRVSLATSSTTERPGR